MIICCLRESEESEQVDTKFNSRLTSDMLLTTSTICCQVGELILFHLDRQSMEVLWAASPIYCLLDENVNIRENSVM